MAAWTVPMSNGMDLQSGKEGMSEQMQKLWIQRLVLQDRRSTAEDHPLPANMPDILPRQEVPPDGSPRGYVRMATMDGKTLKHWAGFKEPVNTKCALDNCQNPLFNFKNVRFCEAHLELQNKCGIIPCSQPIHSPEALTCDNQSHIDWHKQYEDCFHRLSFPGVQRVVQHQLGASEGGTSHEVRGPPLQVQLQALGETLGEQVVHTFKVRQYSGLAEFPLDGESAIALKVLPRVVHQTWAFNTETAEQLNLWLNGFDLQLQQMTDVNYDFFIHVLMMIYGATVEKQIVSKGRELKEEFWEEIIRKWMDWASLWSREAEEGQKRGIKPVVNGGSHWSSALVTGFQ
ncbi:hypothetical protein B0H10DRAFT_1946099 [Mycena sp. CBHHK59/15]|nr:hypothetical protein B0H10DRAFT_1946099 [Mycena sp. CBHHK59/15]